IRDWPPAPKSRSLRSLFVPNDIPGLGALGFGAGAHAGDALALFFRINHQTPGGRRPAGWLSFPLTAPRASLKKREDGARGREPPGFFLAIQRVAGGATAIPMQRACCALSGT